MCIVIYIDEYLLVYAFYTAILDSDNRIFIYHNTQREGREREGERKGGEGKEKRSGGKGFLICDKKSVIIYRFLGEVNDF